MLINWLNVWGWLDSTHELGAKLFLTLDLGY